MRLTISYWPTRVPGGNAVRKQPNGVAYGGRKMRRRRCVSSEPCIDLAPKLGVAFALRLEEQGAGRLLELKRLMKQRLDSAPALGIHD